MGGVGAQVRRSFSPRCSGNNQSDQSKEIMRWKGWTPAGALAVWKRGAEGKEPTNEKYTREGKKKKTSTVHRQPPPLLYYSCLYQCIPDRPSCAGPANHGAAARWRATNQNTSLVTETSRQARGCCIMKDRGDFLFSSVVKPAPCSSRRCSCSFTSFLLGVLFLSCLVRGRGCADVLRITATRLSSRPLSLTPAQWVFIDISRESNGRLPCRYTSVATR